MPIGLERRENGYWKGRGIPLIGKHKPTSPLTGPAVLFRLRWKQRPRRWKGIQRKQSVWWNEFASPGLKISPHFPPTGIMGSERKIITETALVATKTENWTHPLCCPLRRFSRCWKWQWWHLSSPRPTYQSPALFSSRRWVSRELRPLFPPRPVSEGHPAPERNLESRVKAMEVYSRISHRTILERKGC